MFRVCQGLLWIEIRFFNLAFKTNICPYDYVLKKEFCKIKNINKYKEKKLVKLSTRFKRKRKGENDIWAKLLPRLERIVGSVFSTTKINSHTCAPTLFSELAQWVLLSLIIWAQCLRHTWRRTPTSWQLSSDFIHLHGQINKCNSNFNK